MKIDYSILKQFCLQSERSFLRLPNVTVDDHDNIFIDNRSNVLAIAHLDSVCELSHFHVIDIDGTEMVFNAQLDDRLGVYVILELLPQLGILPDILLTTGEEKGMSTGKDFKPYKQYNWMFQFDRHGDDAVHYQYHGWDKTLRKYFNKTSHGAASDISKMAHTGCMGVNIGVGYHDEHDAMCYANMDETVSQVREFERMWWELKDTAFPYTETVATPYSWKGKGKETTTPAPLGVVTPQKHDMYIRPTPLAGTWYLDYEEYRDKPTPLTCLECNTLLVTCPSLYYMGFCAKCEPMVDQCKCGKWRVNCTCDGDVCDSCQEVRPLTDVTVDGDPFSVCNECLKRMTSEQCEWCYQPTPVPVKITYNDTQFTICTECLTYWSTHIPITIIPKESETTSNEHTENSGEKPAILSTNPELPASNSEPAPIGVLHGKGFLGSVPSPDIINPV